MVPNNSTLEFLWENRLTNKQNYKKTQLVRKRVNNPEWAEVITIYWNYLQNGLAGIIVKSRLAVVKDQPPSSEPQTDIEPRSTVDTTFCTFALYNKYKEKHARALFSSELTLVYISFV